MDGLALSCALENAKRSYPMKSRVYICGDVKFPRGDAGSNYIEYLALALIDAGYQVYVLAVSSNPSAQKSGIHNGIPYILFRYGGRVDQKMFYYVSTGRRIVAYLKKEHLTTKDFVIFYTKNAIFLNQINRWLKQNDVRAAACVVEWHQAFQYKYSYLNPEFWMFQLCFYFYYRKVGNIFAISKCLEEIFSRQGCNVLRIPILANPYEFPYHEKAHKKIQFIISGNADKKDSPGNMVEAFNSFSEKELLNIQIHLAGMSQKNAQKLLTRCSVPVKNIIVLHEWLEYKELTALYQEIDYLLIGRPVNKVTLANFPSKVPEMMAFGIIPVVSRVGDYTDIYLNEKNSIIFEGNSSQSCETAIRRALSLGDMQKKEMAKNARQTVESKFAYNKWSQQLKCFIETC